MKKVCIYSDGACSGNPGPGGWGAILVCRHPPARKEINGGEASTTNNRMELTAILQALACLQEPCSVIVTTDSQYVANAFTKGWLARWQQNGWRTANKQPVKNRELWQELVELSAPHDVHWVWVKGHAGHPENERADALAVAAREAVAG